MLLLATALWAQAGLAASTEIHPLKAIESAVRAHLARALAGEQDTEVTVGRLDPRLRLPACGQPLSTRFTHARRNTGSRQVEVRCEGARPWSIYVPVGIARFTDVLVAARTLPRGTVVDTADVVVERRRASLTRPGHLSDPAMVAGQVTTRVVQAGEALNLNALRRPRLVRRGQRVVLESTASAVRVRMTGKALADGAAGERIAVRNLSSRRVVEGTVSAPGVVLVGYAAAGR